VILGESFSGPIAIEVAATNRRVVGLILASSFARHPLPQLFVPFTRVLDMKWIPNSIVVSALLGRTGTDELKSHLMRVLMELPPKVIRARAAEVLRVDKRRRLREVKCPILQLHGRYDRLVSRKYVVLRLRMRRPDKSAPGRSNDHQRRHQLSTAFNDEGPPTEAASRRPKKTPSRNGLGVE
jgi:pimeloyl-ACP methyl ester carboxylesterase